MGAPLNMVARFFSLVIAVILATIVLGYGPVNVRDEVSQTASTKHHHDAPVSVRHMLDHELRPKSIWTLLRNHARGEDDLDRSTSLWDDDDDDDEDIGPGSHIPFDDDELVSFGSAECVGLSTPADVAVFGREVKESTPRAARGVGPASGYATPDERPPRAARG